MSFEFKTAIWQDAKFRDLSMNAKMLFFKLTSYEGWAGEELLRTNPDMGTTEFVGALFSLLDSGFITIDFNPEWVRK